MNTQNIKYNNLANLITFARIIGVALIFWFTPFSKNITALYVICLYVGVAATDFFDGWVARKYNIETDVGKVLDPLADKLLILVFLPLLTMQVIPSFPVFIILAREFSIMAIRVFSAKQGLIIPAQFSGKLKTAITFPLCGILFGRVPVDTLSDIPLFLLPLEKLRLWVMAWPQMIIDVLIWTTVVVTVWSFLDYLKDFFWQQSLIKAKQDEKEAKKLLLAIIPMAITLVNFCCGFVAMFFAVFHTLESAIVLVLLGMYLDALDGRVARKLNVKSNFGARLDTKADFVSFGLAPAVIIFKWFYVQPHFLFTVVGLCLALSYFYSIFYRLRRFDEGGHSHFFDGLPSPVSAAVVILSGLLPFLKVNPVFYVILLLLICLLTVSRIQYPHLSYAGRETYLKHFTKPGLLIFFLAMFKLLGVPYILEWPMYELLLGFTSIYLISPIFVKSK